MASLEETTHYIEVMNAYRAGEPIECTHVYEELWREASSPTWNWETTTYRIKKQKPSIDWTHISSEYKYLCVDADGTACLSVEKPVYSELAESWIVPHGDLFAINERLTSYSCGNCLPKDSLVERPVEDD